MSASTGNYASVNGLRVYYEVHSDGRPLVLLHGGVTTIELTFGDLVASFAEHHQVIAVDLQGHGRTADTDREMSLPALAEDVVTLLGQLDIDQADFFGFSLGALVSFTIAIRYPNVVHKLVLASANYRPDGYDSDARDTDPAEVERRMPTAADSSRCAICTKPLRRIRSNSTRWQRRRRQWCSRSPGSSPKRCARSLRPRSSSSATPTSPRCATQSRCSS